MPLDSIISLPEMYPEYIHHKRENHKHLKVFIVAPNLLECVCPPATLFVVIKTIVSGTKALLQGKSTVTLAHGYYSWVATKMVFRKIK